MANYILALDIGTSSTRALLYTASGAPVPDVRAQLTYELTISHEGEVSVDADFLVELVARTIDEVLHKAGERAGSIVGVATSAFWHTLVPLDASGKPLLQLLTWEDTRPQQSATVLRSQLDETAIHQRTGARLHTSYWPAKLAWLASAHPEIAQRAARYVSFGEYLHERFLGRAICSLSMASGTGLLNTRTQSWDSELLAFLQLSPAQLSPLGDLPKGAGREARRYSQGGPTQGLGWQARPDALQGLTPALAARWPALSHVPWFPAIGDGAAANIGSNCTNIGTWAVTMGTSSAMRVVVPPAQVTPQEGLWLYAVDQRRALLGSALSEGGNMLAWLRQTLQLPDLAELEGQLAQLQPAAHGLTILPMLAGERGPGWHAHATMTISGLTIHTTPAEIALAGLEAVVFQLSRVYGQLTNALSGLIAQPRLIASGGALLNSPILQHILADTLNCPLELTDAGEASARGVALLALEALGLLPDLSRLTPAPATIVQPDPARHAIYTLACERQKNLYELIFNE